MTTVKEILDAEDARWHDLAALFDKLGPDDWNTPGVAGDWCAKDVLLHLAAWHAEAVDEMEQLRETGHVKRNWTEVQAFNADAHENCKDVDLHDARVSSGAARHRFREEIARLGVPLNEKMATFVVACGPDHYDEHIEMLQSYLGARA
jgi:hypothetical protein